MLSTNNSIPIPCNSTSYSHIDPSTASENTEENVLTVNATNPVTMLTNTKSPKKTVSYASNQEFQFSNQKLQQGLSLNIRGYDDQATFNFHFHYSNSTNDNEKH
ncbi:hypothetical protein PPYR_01957 [Photinus pyralis]|uniref:Uncharacterized protein n=1 Tax=Photinus pyralis TaxID=7054 RepID=A0A5N4B5U6_PHOPY|nr:hypothetical protein PPYR_01957 [Photinus pyralis]